MDLFNHVTPNPSNHKSEGNSTRKPNKPPRSLKLVFEDLIFVCKRPPAAIPTPIQSKKRKA